MNQKLIDMLMAGLSRFNTDLVAAHIGTDQELFNDLVDIMLMAPSPLPFRAAWAIGIITDTNPWLVEPRIDEIFDKRKSFNHPSLTRFLLRYMAQSKIPHEKMGEIFDYCYNILNKTSQPTAIRVHAMQVLFNIAAQEPDLKNELILLIESHLETGSSGFVNRAEKLLKILKSVRKTKITTG